MTTVATEARLEVENVRATALPITAMTKASPPVATSAGHGLTNGDIVLLLVSDGMIELNGQVCRIANADTDTFELERLNTTGYADWVSGSGDAYPISSWLTVSPATDIDISNASPTELDASKLINRTSVTLYGRSGAKSGSVSMHDEPFVSAVEKLDDASSSDILAFRITWNDGSTKLFGAYTAYDGGFSANNNQIVTGSFNVSVPARVASYPA